MKRLFLKPLKVIEHTEIRENFIHKVDVSDKKEMQIEEFDGWYDDVKTEATSTENENELFSSSDYGEDTTGKSKIEVKVKNTDKFKQYTLSPASIVSLKQATVSTEAKTPFVVAKTVNKKSKAEDTDTIYKTEYKIKHNEQKSGTRLGFIEASKVYEKASNRLLEGNKIIGVANEEFPIRSKKRFNQKRVGYIKLLQCTDSINYYVEITQSRGYLWMLAMALIITALVILVSGHDWSDWKLDPSNFNLYKTKEVAEYKEQMMGINHLDGLTLKDNSVNIGLEIKAAEKLKFKMSVYLEDKSLIYESDMLDAGQGIESFKPNKQLKPGKYKCIIKCDIYKDKNKRSTDTLESSFSLTVK